MADDESRKLLVKSLEDVYALEAQLVKVLGEHAQDAQDEPMIRQKIEQHLRETELHRDRIEQRLNALGVGKPGMKTALSSMMGQMVGAMSGSRTNVLAKNARDEYTSEHMEIASYVELITIAQTLGDIDTVRTAQLNLRDEVAMQQWLIQHMPEATLKGLQKEGLQVPANALPAAQSIFADMGLGTFGGPQPGLGTAQPPYQAPPPPTPPPVIS
jgi:ferritin-like metal-binding protein YciE